MKKLLLLISLLLATNAWAEIDKAEAIATTINIIIITAVNVGD